MKTLSLFITVLYFSSQISSISCHWVEVLPLNPTKPSLADLHLIESFSASQSQSEVVECSTNNSKYIGTLSGKAKEKYRWRKGFFVHPDPEFTEDELTLINAAMYDLSQVLCIDVKIWPQDSSPTGDYAFIKKDYDNIGCFSAVGRQGGKQTINLGARGCLHKHTIVHESIHALGFDHEQNRPDRDDYIQVLWKNIKPGKEHNFDLAENSVTFDVPYDYHSIMHYESYAFAKDKKKPTMLKQDGRKITSNTEISEYDTMKLQRMYNCTET